MDRAFHTKPVSLLPSVLYDKYHKNASYKRSTTGLNYQLLFFNVCSKHLTLFKSKTVWLFAPLRDTQWKPNVWWPLNPNYIRVQLNPPAPLPLQLPRQTTLLNIVVLKWRWVLTNASVMLLWMVWESFDREFTSQRANKNLEGLPKKIRYVEMVTGIIKEILLLEAYICFEIYRFIYRYRENNLGWLLLPLLPLGTDSKLQLFQFQVFHILQFQTHLKNDSINVPLSLYTQYRTMTKQFCLFIKK